MIKTFKALWANTDSENPNDHSQINCQIRETKFDELPPGDILIRVEYSSINYKDALAVTGQGKILRQLPLIPGIDLAGTVAESNSPKFKEGDPVLINGCNFGEKHCGGFSEYVRAPADTVLLRTNGLSSKEAMILGTAGFTAALAIHQLELNGLRPEKGDVLVTGATGGVGSLALSMLNHLGYETEAWTRRESQREWLELCGAARVTDVHSKNFSTRPLESVVWSAAIDNVGGEYLSHILPRIDLWGSLASIGLAQKAEYSSTVFPFILRGVNILGISSNNCPFQLRQQLWEKMSDSLKPSNLDHILSKVVTLENIASEAKNIIEGKHFGRVIVKL